MKTALIVLALLAGCKVHKGGVGSTWSGIPIGQRVCGGFAKFSNAQTCIVDGVAYVCVFDWDSDHNTCARLSPSTAEAT